MRAADLQRLLWLSGPALLCLAVQTASADPLRVPSGKDAYRLIARQEARKAGLPDAVADVVMAIESGYDPTRIGGVGEIGLMQVRPGTAAMLGFSGTPAELAKPEVNIHYGVAYLAEAWRKADGDLCRALMKYRAGHGQEVMTPLSAAYCARARAHLALGDPSLIKGALLSAEVAAETSLGDKVLVVPKLDLRQRASVFSAAWGVRMRAINAAIDQRRSAMAETCRSANEALARPSRRSYAQAIRQSVRACALRVAVR